MAYSVIPHSSLFVVALVSKRSGAILRVVDTFTSEADALRLVSDLSKWVF